MKFINRICLFLLLITAVSFSFSCKKTTSEPDPIAITVIPDRITLLFRIGEEFDEMSFRFQHEGKNYSTRVRYAVGEANVETNVNNTQLIPTNAVLSNFGGSSDFDGKPNILKSDKINTSTSFKITFKSFREGNAFVGSIKLFKEITVNIGPQTQIAFQGATGGLYAKYITNAPAFSILVQNMLNSFNDSNASTSGNQPMPMDGWVDTY